MRTEQYMGLSPRAHELIQSLGVIQAPDPNGIEYGAWNTSKLNRWVTTIPEINTIDEAIAKLQAKRTELVDALPTIFTEFIQADPWSSGPMWFVGLDSPVESLKEAISVGGINWAQDEIDSTT